MQCAVKGCNDEKTNQLVIKIEDKNVIIPLCDNCADAFEKIDLLQWELV